MNSLTGIELKWWIYLFHFSANYNKLWSCKICSYIRRDIMTPFSKWLNGVNLDSNVYYSKKCQLHSNPGRHYGQWICGERQRSYSHWKWRLYGFLETSEQNFITPRNNILRCRNTERILISTSTAVKTWKTVFKKKHTHTHTHTHTQTNRPSACILDVFFIGE